MKRILCLLFTLACIFTGLGGCNLLNKQPVTLADGIAIPEDGMIEASVFEALKAGNKAATFIGKSNGIRYEWIVFGSDIQEIKALNLGLEITEADGKKIAFRFLSGENFGFSPALSIYLNDLWDTQSASVCEFSTSGAEKKQQATITGSTQSILNFSPETQTGAFVITSDVEANAVSVPSAPVERATPDTDSSEKPEASQIPRPSQNTSSAKTQDSYTESPRPKVTEPPPESKRPISDGKSTEQDQYKTDPVPEGKPLPAEPEDQTVNTKKTYTCTLSIECSSIFNNLDDLEPEKLDILPTNGVLFAPQTVLFYEGESVYDVLKRICKDNRIHMEASWTPMYNSAYVEGIGNLYEFDCGDGSGWMYRVNGWYPNYGCSRYQLKQREKIEWRYTCDLGKDIGGANAIGG